jgi:hypothetical protein
MPALAIFANQIPLAPLKKRILRLQAGNSSPAVVRLQTITQKLHHAVLKQAGSNQI